VGKSILIALFALSSVSAARVGDAKSEVLAAMDGMKQAMINRDGAALEKLLADNLTYTHSAGQEQNKAEVIQSVVSGKASVQKLEFTDNSVRVLGNVALVKGKVDLWHSPENVVHMNILHVWMHGAHGWQLVARQATRLQ
jgi:ketosteroid isomerase-like protein